MVSTTDAKKAYRMLRRAIAGRRRAQRVRRMLAQRAPHPHGHYRIAVYFADKAVNMYQIRQWYRPLQGLADRWPVVVLARSASGAAALLEDDALPVAFVPQVRDLEGFLEEQDIRIVLYVNQNTRNFQMFRYGGRWHVFINHGESDKVYMTSNQFKAYDYALIAGPAARDRLAAALWDYDVDERTIQIGRPQADHFSGELPYPPDDRLVVLYAPTWEGDRASMSYGSVRSHGVELVERLLATGRHRVIYRPHPRTGIMDEAYAAANRRIIGMLRDANAADPAAHHVHDDGPEIGWQLAAADVAIADISAMIYDRLATGKPLLITRPASPEAEIDETGYLSDCEWLTADAASRIVEEIDRVREDERSVARLRGWVRRYFGDTAPGAATARFHAAIERLMREWEAVQVREDRAA
ncbi:CDP-glycerol glycerophosphotransferase family protein [Microbacterium sp. EF45047]|uniref:CDP-glycerol glycerophosphotransferase family protein n=1 Tax=Microbacterium sp. EF45047 TaxID=2809708 RepID=UPI00234ADBBE|nr:CDP-glycerol glycerophosphotransferase family protein [Microbacterium sp. EF45047]WCM56339.1 CDP-glycerol glycerophosphotransferase family protein [Microbacterium sp. EF45047]